MNRTKIEYLTHTWNPIAMRCDPVSEGCANCWHLGMAKRLAGREGYKLRDAYAGRSLPVLVGSRLDEPLRLRGTATIGVQFMGDLFHKNVPFRSIDKVLAVMALCPQRTFILLTKRAERMHEYFCDYPSVSDEGNIEWELSTHPALLWEAAEMFGGTPERYCDLVGDETMASSAYQVELNRIPTFPLPNVIGMVTAENQEQADKRIPWLLRTPFAVRGVSVEPMLGAVDLDYPCLDYHSLDFTDTADIMREYGEQFWIVNGAETGPGARPMDLDWARSLRDQCKAAGVPYFFKRDSDGNRTLDGVMWKEYPEAQ